MKEWNPEFKANLARTLENLFDFINGYILFGLYALFVHSKPQVALSKYEFRPTYYRRTASLPTFFKMENLM